MIVETIKIKAKECGKGYYLRWYADGWNSWLFKGGFETFNTKGEVFKSVGYSSLSIGDVVNVTELNAIRGILRAKFIEILTNDGWKSAVLDNESWKLGRADRLIVAISFTITVWLKGAAQILSEPIVITPPTPPINYGRLYNWYAAKNVNFAPIDWAVPSASGINTLISSISDGGSLKEAGLIHWNYPNAGATNISNFTAYGAGIRSYTGIFEYINDYGYFWGKDDLGYGGDGMVLFYHVTTVNHGGGLKASGASIRLLYTGIGSPTTMTDYDGNVYDVIQIGTQYWTKQNWACTKLNDGTPIPEVTDNTTWAGLTTMARCDYNNDPLNV